MRLRLSLVLVGGSIGRSSQRAKLLFVYSSGGTTQSASAILLTVERCNSSSLRFKRADAALATFDKE